MHKTIKLFAANKKLEFVMFVITIDKSFFFQVQKYQALLDDIIVKDNGVNLVPELYYVPIDKVLWENERYAPLPRKGIVREKYRMLKTYIQPLKKYLFKVKSDR